MAVWYLSFPFCGHGGFAWFVGAGGFYALLYGVFFFHKTTINGVIQVGVYFVNTTILAILWTMVWGPLFFWNTPDCLVFADKAQSK